MSAVSLRKLKPVT